MGACFFRPLSTKKFLRLHTVISGAVIVPLDIVVTTLKLTGKQSAGGNESDSTEKMPETTTKEAQPEEGASDAPKEYRNIVLTGFGGLKMLKVQKKPAVAPSEGQVSVRVKACGMNFVDLMVRQGVLEHPPKTPVTMGFECAGEVEAVGENTPDFSVGDQVICFSNYGAWGEVAVVPAKFVYKMPSNMSYQDGAALPMNYLAAYIMLFDIANLRKDMSVFAQNIGGGMGHAISQLCKTVEGITLYGTASAHKIDAVKDKVTQVFDRTADYCQEVRKLKPEGVDLVLDCMCGEDANKGISLLKPMGKYILYGTSNIVTGETKSFFSFAKSRDAVLSRKCSWEALRKKSLENIVREGINSGDKWWQVDKVSPIKLFDENRTLAGFQLRTLAFQQNQHEYIRDVMNKVFKLYRDGKIKPVVDSTYAFEDVADAMQKMHDRKNIGKMILDPTKEPTPKTPPQAESNSPSSQEENKDSPVVNGDQQ